MECVTRINREALCYPRCSVKGGQSEDSSTQKNSSRVILIKVQLVVDRT